MKRAIGGDDDAAQVERGGGIGIVAIPSTDRVRDRAPRGAKNRLARARVPFLVPSRSSIRAVRASLQNHQKMKPGRGYLVPHHALRRREHGVYAFVARDAIDARDGRCGGRRTTRDFDGVHVFVVDALTPCTPSPRPPHDASHLVPGAARKGLPDDAGDGRAVHGDAHQHVTGSRRPEANSLVPSRGSTKTTTRAGSTGSRRCGGQSSVDPSARRA